MSSVTKPWASMGLIAVLLAGMGLPAWAVDGAIRDIRFDPAGRVFRIDASAPVSAHMSALAIAGRKRIIVDVENAEIGRELPRDIQLTQQLSQVIPALRQVTTHQYGNPGHPIVRILLDLDPSVDRAVENVRLRRAQGTFLELSLDGAPASGVDAAPIKTSLESSSQGGDEMPTLRPSHREPLSRQAVSTTSIPSSEKQAVDDGSKMEAMKRALLRINQRYEQLMRENGQLAQQLREVSREAEQTRTRLNGQVEALQTENASLKLQVQKTPSNPSPAINQRDEQLLREKGRLDQELRALRAEVGQTQSRLTQQIEALRAENATLKTRKPVGDVASADSSARDKSPSPEELSTLRKQVTTAQISLNESIRTINAQNKEIAYLRNQVTDVKTGLDIASRQQMERLQSEVGEKESRIRDLERQLAEKTAQAVRSLKSVEPPDARPPDKAKAAGELAELRRESETLKRQLENLRRENTILQERAEKSPASPSASASVEAEQHYQSGKAAMAARQPEQAVAAYRQAQVLDPDNGRYILDYSAALTEARQYAEGITLLTNYLSKHPTDREAYTQLGKLYLLNDQPDAATQAFTRAVPISTLNNYATALKKTGRLDEAESVFKLALTINPKDSEVLFNLGNLYNAADKLPQAKDYYLKALSIRPDFAEAHYNLGLIHAKLGERPEAISHLQEFLKLSPKARNAETIRAYIEKLKV